MKLVLLAFASYVAANFSPHTVDQKEQAIIHEINAQICQNALNTVWEHEYDFNFGPQPRSNQEIIAAIKRLNNANCYENPSINQIDAQLIKKEAQKITAFTTK